MVSSCKAMQNFVCMVNPKKCEYEKDCAPRLSLPQAFRRACGNTSKQFFPVAIRNSGTICFICTGSTDVSHLSFSFGVGCDSLVQRWGVVIPQSSRALFCPFQMGYWGFVTLEPRVSHYRVPSQRTPPRGRCKCTFFTPSWAR